MARTTIQVRYTNFEGLQERLAALLHSRGYKSITENNENVWKCGIGFLTAMKYIKIEFAADHTLLISGWIRVVAGGEQDLTGFVGALPKKQVMNLIQEIQSIVR